MSALPAVPEPQSLDGAIEQQINLGEKDPLTIARNCARLYGDEWVAEQLAGHWETILAEIARQRLGNERRATVTSIMRERQGKKISKREAVLTSVFIPSKGWMALGDCTVDDIAAREAYMRRLANGLNRWADYWSSLGAMLVEQNAPRVRDLKGQLPDLPAQALEA